MKFFDFFVKHTPPPTPNVQNFLHALAEVAPPAGLGAYALKDGNGGYHGFVQFIINSPFSVTIHRLWTLEPGNGNGSIILKKVCELADQHGVELTLKAIPFGRKPYPLSTQQLADWYQRHGFQGQRGNLSRPPRTLIQH